MDHLWQGRNFHSSALSRDHLFLQGNLNFPPFLRALCSSVLKGAPAFAQGPHVLPEPWFAAGTQGKSWLLLQPLKPVSEHSDPPATSHPWCP